jgi:hypothetical protein
VAETGTNTVVVDCLMYGGSASNFNPYGLDTTGWLSSNALSAGAGKSLYRRFNGHDTDQVWDWWYTENPTPNPFADISDSDGDGLTDAEELTGSRNPYGEPTNPHNADSDGDGLSDYAECITHGTNPNTWATDDDIYPWPPPSGAVSDWWGSDSYEIANGWDPLNPDENTNGIPDSWEMAFPGTNLYGHADNDGISNFDELMQNSNPNDPDSYTAQPYVIRYESSMPGWANDGMKDIGLRGWVKIYFEDLKTNLDLCVWVQEGRTQEQFRVEWRGATQKDIHWLSAQEVVTSARAKANTQPYLFVQDSGQRSDFTNTPGGEYKIIALSVEFIDEVPDYSLDWNTDSDNFFLRECDSSGKPDSEDLYIYYRIFPVDVPVSDVKIRVYKGEASTPELVLDGVKDADGNYRTGDNLHTNWTASVDLAEDHPGFYRLQLSVSVEGQGAPVLETSIADADGATPGWQCPQDCLAVHDLHWKHRPVVHVHTGETGTPTSPAEFIANSALNTTATNSANHFYDLFRDGQATVGDWSDFTPAQQAILTSDANDRTLYHSSNRTDAPNFVFLQYWMFENFSQRPYGVPLDIDPPNIQHEGDVEHCHITIKLKEADAPAIKSKWLSPFAATASQHYYAQTLKWDLINGGAAANAHSQEHVQHANNRLFIYIAHGAHATYFVSDPDIEVPDFNGYLGTQGQYSPSPRGAYDKTSPSFLLPSYQLKHVDTTQIGSFLGHWGYYDPNDTGSWSNNGPSGTPFRAAKTSGGALVNLRTQPKTLHNLSRKTSQLTEMSIP